jgi:TolA-binding protein
MKTKICLCILIAVFIALPTAHAGTKEELVRLQNEVKILQQQFLEFSEVYNERFNGLHSLVVQLNDEIARSNNSLSRINLSLSNRTEDARGQEMSLLSEIRELSKKLDDTSIGITVLAQQFNDYKLQAATRPGGTASSLSAQNMYSQAFRDYTLGDFELAIEGFHAVIESFPAGETAAQSWLYIGESHSGLNQLKEAVDAYTRVINDYPQAAIVPTALFKRARIENALQDRDNAIADYKDILDRFPTSVEAEQARGELRLLEAAQQKPKTPAKQQLPPAKKTTR